MPRVGEVDLQQRAVDRQGRTQLVRGVPDEPLLRGEGPLQPVQHVVEGVGELLELVVGPVQLDAAGEVRAGDGAGDAGDPAQRREHPPRHGVAEGEGDDAQAHQGEQRPVEQRVQCLLALVVDAGVHRGVDRVRRVAVFEEVADLAGHVAVDDLERQLTAHVQCLRRQHVDDRQQQDARDQEHAAVQQREPYPDGRTQPGVRGLLLFGLPGGLGGCGRRGGGHGHQIR